MRKLVSLVLLLSLLAGCGGPAQPNQPTPPGGGIPSPVPGPTEVSPDAVTISFAAWDYERQVYEPLAEKFMQENPGISVVIVPLDDIMNVPSDPSGAGETQLSALRRVVQGADTAPSFMVTPEAYGTPLLLDLKPLMDADATFQRDDFYPGAIERFSTDAGSWVLPRFFYLQVMAYNKDLFQAAGLPDPKPDWDWGDALAAAEQVQAVGGAGSYGLLDMTGGLLPFLVLLNDRGTDVLNMPADQVQLTEPVYLEAVESLRDLYRKQVIFNPYAGGASATPEDPAQILREGRAGIWGDFPLFTNEGQVEELPYPVARVPFPASPRVDQFYGGGGEGYIISGGTANPEASWRWIEFLSRQPIDQQRGPILAGKDGRTPARKALADALNYWDGVDQQTADVYRYVLENGAVGTNRSLDYTVIGALGQAINQIVSDPSANPEQALAEAQRFLEDIRAQASTTPTPAPDTSPVLVATPEPQTIPEGATVVSFASWGFSGSDLRRIVRKFREDNPDIYVQIKNTDTLTVSVSMAELAKLSDCFAWQSLPQSDADAQAVLDMRPLLDADATFQRDDIPLALQSAYERGGILTGIPYVFNVRTLTYNRTLFDEVGLEPPSAASPWTTEQFLQAAQALSSGEGEARVYGYVPLGGASNDLLLLNGLLGGQLTTGSGLDTRPNFTSAESQQAIRWYLDLDTVHGVTPTMQFPYKRDDAFNDRSYELIQGGKGAMWFDYGKGGFGQPMPMPMEPPMGKPIGPGGPGQVAFEVGVAPLPLGDKGLSRGDIYVRGFHISKGTQNPQACWEFIKFFSSDISQMYGDIPARSSIANSDAYKAVAAPDRIEVLEIYQEVLKRPIREGTDMNNFYSLDPYWFFKAISAVAKGDGDLATELDSAQKYTTTYAECVAKGGTPPTCALEADPTYEGYNTEGPMPLDAVPAGAVR